jgi:hypothetical protein
MFAKAASTALEFSREMAHLNETYFMTKRESAEVSSAVAGISLAFGKTREDAIETVKTLLDLGMIPRVANEAGTSIKELARISTEFSAATGVASGEAAGLIDQLLRVNRVGSTNIRSTAFAIKAVADNSHMTTQELLALNKAIEPIFAHFADKSEGARAAWTKNMMGVGGALSKLGISAERTSANFGNMLNSASAEGQKALGQLASFTDLNTDTLREMIQTDPAAIFDRLAVQAAKFKSQGSLQVMATQLSGINMSFEDAARLADEFGVKGPGAFKSTVASMIVMEQKNKSAADIAAARQTQLDSLMTGFKKEWEDLMLSIGGPMLTKVIQPIMKRLIPALKEVVKYLSNVDWDKVFGRLEAVIRRVVAFIEGIDNIISHFDAFAAMTLGMSPDEYYEKKHAAEKKAEAERKRLGSLQKQVKDVPLSPLVSLTTGQEMPDTVTAHAPRTESLLREQNATLAQIRNAVSGGGVNPQGTRAGASYKSSGRGSPKTATARSLAGAD